MGQESATTQLLNVTEHNRTKAQTLLNVRLAHRQLKDMSTFQTVPSAQPFSGVPGRRRWLTLPEAARESGLSLYIIRKAAKTGELPAVSLCGRLWVTAEVLESRLRPACCPACTNAEHAVPAGGGGKR